MSKENRRIMLVEDESIIAKDIENILLNYGFDVVGIFSRAEDAIEKVVELNPDLILMDIVLKGQIDGIEAAQKIYEIIQVPIIYLTAYADEETISRIVDTVPYGYFLKPFEEKELYTWIQTTLTKFEIDKNLKETLLTRDNDLKKIEYLASHDLQEPLRMIASYVRLLQKKYFGNIDSEADEYIKFAVDGANRMKALVNNLLDYSRIRTDNFTLEKTDINETVRDVIYSLEKEFKTITINSIIDKLPLLMVDKSHFKILFYNIISQLISNFEPEPIFLKIRFKEEPKYYFFSVTKTNFEDSTDNCNESEPAQDNIETISIHKKNEFWYSLCEKIVEFYKGKIWLSSNSGNNNVINFTILKNGTHTSN